MVSFITPICENHVRQQKYEKDRKQRVVQIKLKPFLLQYIVALTAV